MLSKECLSPGAALRRRLLIEHPALLTPPPATTTKVATTGGDGDGEGADFNPFAEEREAERLSINPMVQGGGSNAGGDDGGGGSRSGGIEGGMGDVSVARRGQGLVHVFYDASTPLARSYEQLLGDQHQRQHHSASGRSTTTSQPSQEDQGQEDGGELRESEVYESLLREIRERVILQTISFE